MVSTQICEACKINPTSIEEPTEIESQPFRLCAPCHKRLTTSALKPIEWYNLAVAHSPNTYWLHDDFYEEDGEAMQPEEDVEVTEDDLAPSLEDVKGDLEALLDLSITRWYLEEDVIDAFKNHDKKQLLKSIQSRFNQTESYEIKGRMLEISSNLLGTSSQVWVRELWRQQYDEYLLTFLSDAAASSLPMEEGLRLVYEKLATIREKELPSYAVICLSPFRSPDVLSWIEDHCQTFHDNWGRLAAVSHPTWAVMRSWIYQGKPISLVALDTMANCTDNEGDPLLESYNQTILQTKHSEIKSVLEDYLQENPSPRVKNKTKFILENIDYIFSR